MSHDLPQSDYIKAASQNLLPDLIRFRRHLHQNPELSFEEFKTAEFIAEKLNEMGIEYRDKVAGTGIVALIKGKNADKNCVALRADMDALPIKEENENIYRSQNDGVMHACGHDVHTTCLLGAARILQDLKNEFEGTIKLIFQPGEEKCPGGAGLMIKAGALENPKPKVIFGQHVDPALASGTVGFRQGEYMASTDELHIKVIGKGGHAALPHLAVDPISIAALIITALQQVVARKANPLVPTVLTFGKISGGETTNVIPNEVEILGTLRTFDEAWRTEAKKTIIQTIENIASAYGAEAEVNIPQGYPSVYNNPDVTEMAQQSAGSILGEKKVLALDRRMTAEDFSFYGQVCKACFYRLGTNENGKNYTTSLHNARFDIHEPAMVTGVQMFCTLALAALQA